MQAQLERAQRNVGLAASRGQELPKLLEGRFVAGFVLAQQILRLLAQMVEIRPVGQGVHENLHA